MVDQARVLWETSYFTSSGMAFYQPPEAADGISSASLSRQLDKNTIVRKFDVIVHAEPATRTEAQQVAQVRAYETAGKHTLVLDFGTPRTVSEIAVLAARNTDILNVKPWTGAQFGVPFYPTGTGASPVAKFSSEVRTERLLVEISGKLDAATLGTDVTLVLPDPPSDLEIRINGGAPVWTSPGPVQRTDAVAVTADRWNKDFKRRVPLADALNALLADPLGEGEVTLDVVLSSKVPGRISLTPDPEPPPPAYSHIHRIKFDAETAVDLEFDQEGWRSVELTLPVASSRLIETVRLTLLGTLPPERVLPPTGPDWSRAPSDPELPLAELVLDPARAAAVRLDSTDLAELYGVRLPLTAPADGAEIRVALWSADPSTGEPLEAIPTGVSKPVTLAGGETPDTWTTFVFVKPVPIESDLPPWVAVLITRGSVTWSLAGAGANQLRRGAPAGPWRPLPGPFQSSAAPAVMAARGRIRAIGHGSKTVPVPPLILGLAGPAWPARSIDATPTAKGVPGTLTFDPPMAVSGPNPTLMVESRVAGTVTLRDIDVTWREP